MGKTEGGNSTSMLFHLPLASGRVTCGHVNTCWYHVCVGVCLCFFVCVVEGFEKDEVSSRIRNLNHHLSVDQVLTS